MFLCQDADCEGFYGIVRKHGHRSLSNDWAGVHLICGNVHRTPGNLNPSLQGILLRLRIHASRKGWQERWMYVDDPIVIGPHPRG